ncbi:hypothetical protein [Streptomyces sp. JB150]|uniref:hypothetical protein n=1 Tax=Streptomyces sp. JB150 TaxID=2714844 RepID=UPI0014076352|nr:hypothetical protein [Streptomyces sp. JB150]QIJ62594.1 hypothetical protein G7Z13_11505 [Streptomyces sp. JB150]
MTATMHIGRRTTRHHPLTSLRARWEAFQLRHSRRALDAYFEQARLRRPVTDPHRHAWENSALEAAFAQLAADHPEAVTPADGGTPARHADRETLLLAACDAWFRDVHGPEHRWSPRTVAAYEQLLHDVRACFHPGGAR